MKSRYDYMEPSTVLDTDGDSYPDCLTTSYANVKITEVPTFSKISQGDIQKFWVYMNKYYGSPYYDDLLLNFNMVPYIGYMSPGYIMMNPSLSDLVGFNTNKVKEDF